MYADAHSGTCCRGSCCPNFIVIFSSEPRLRELTVSVCVDVERATESVKESYRCTAPGVHANDMQADHSFDSKMDSVLRRLFVGSDKGVIRQGRPGRVLHCADVMIVLRTHEHGAA